MTRVALECFAAAHELFTAQEAFVLVTLVMAEGHVPQVPGAKALVTQKGLHFGTVGGGKIEARAISMAQELLSKVGANPPPPQLHRIDLQRDLGMSCGGVAHLLLETYGLQPWHILVFGAGHVAQALVRLLLQLDCRITCVDSRQEWLGRLPESPYLRTICVEDMATVAAEAPADSYCLTVSKGHATDLPILQRLLPRSDLPYIGAIGSTVKARSLRAGLMREGVSQDDLAKLICPIGLPLGSSHPGEIAVSIAAQLLQVRDQKRKAFQSKTATVETSK